MAEGLSVSALQGFSGGEGLRNLFDLTRNSSQLAESGPSRSGEVSEPRDGSKTPLGDFFDFGGSGPPGLEFGPGGGFQVAPDGTYRFQSFAAQASFDLEFSQTTVSIGNGEDDSSVFASLTELNFSFSFSAQFEEALIETGRTRGGDPHENLSNAARGVASRFAARQVQATLNFSVSFSQATLSINDAGAGSLDDSEGLIPEDLINGFATLLETFFGDDERFDDFLDNLRGFLQDLSGAFGSGDAPQIEADSPDVAPAAEVAEVSSDGEQPAESGVQFESTQLDISLEVAFESTRIEIVKQAQEKIQEEDPIVLDIDGDGIELTSVAEGVDFDLDGDGESERIATATGGDGFLALDRNGNGTIDSGRELFGDQNGAANGFDELRKFDSNQDGVIDSRDTIFDELRVFIDANRDGVSQSDELYSLADLGIESISLADRDVDEKAAGGNTIAQRSYFTRTDGSQSAAVDVLLNTLA